MILQTKLMPTPCLGCLTPLLPAETFTIYDLNRDPFENQDLFDQLSSENPQLLHNLKSKFFVSILARVFFKLYTSHLHSIWQALAAEITYEEEEPLTFHLEDFVDLDGVLLTDYCNLDGTRSKGN